MSFFPYHPEYGLPDSFREKVVKYYLSGDSTIREVAAHFRVGRSSVVRWTQDFKKKECPNK